jgi:RHS repeat-associated protein
MGAVTPDGSNHISIFTYDLSGNTLNDGVYAYKFNAEGEMTKGNGVTYLYDADGRRVSRSGRLLYWYGSGGDVLWETTMTGGTKAEYVYFGGKRVAMIPTSGAAQYYVEDFLGSSRVLTQNTGTVCYDADFSPYGGEQVVTDTCAQNARKFEGKERDSETLNDDFGARYYSWRFGRWLSADWSSVPVAVPYANLTNPQTLNLYSMVADDPESFADLDGHQSTPAPANPDLHCSTAGAHPCLPPGQTDDDKSKLANSTAQVQAQNTSQQQASQTTSNSSTSTSTDRVATALSNVPGVASVTPAPDPARDKAIGGHQNETDALTFKTPEDQAKFLAESSRKHTIPGDVSENGFGPGVRLPGGLHAEQGRVDPSTGQFLVTSHIDRFNPNNGLGPMVGHAVVDVFIGTLFFHHTAGLDQ